MCLVINFAEYLEERGVRYMEQLLIVEDDIGLNQGLRKDQVIWIGDYFYKTSKTAKEQLFYAVYPSDPVGYQSAGWCFELLGRSRKPHPGFWLFC